MRNIVLFFIVIGVLLLGATFVLCIMVFHPNTTSIVVGLVVPFIIFLLLKKKLEQVLKIDESLMEVEEKNENLGKINLDKPVNGQILNETPSTVNQNRDGLKDFFKNNSLKPSEKLKRNDFSFSEIKDINPYIFQQCASVQNKLGGDMGTINFSIPYPDPFLSFRIKAIKNILKNLFQLK